jgi:hypothetical protein
MPKKYVRKWGPKLWIDTDTDMGWVHTAQCTVRTLLTLSKNGENTARAYQVDKETNPYHGYFKLASVPDPVQRCTAR